MLKHLKCREVPELFFEDFNRAVLLLFTLNYDLQQSDLDPGGCVLSHVLGEEAQNVHIISLSSKLNWRVRHIVRLDCGVHPTKIVGLNTSCILIISDNIVIFNCEGQDITHAPKGCG